MTRRLTDIELDKAQMLRTIRAAVRHKHSLAAFEELNQVLPEAEARFDAALRKGELPDPKAYLEVLGA